MKFTETPLSGAYLVELEPHRDDRGFFARMFSAQEFREQGLRDDLSEVSLSRNLHVGTLRGMHFQRAPHEETKLVRAVRGRAFDVIVDIRTDSATYMKSHGTILDAEFGSALYIPKGFAHGFLTLTDETDILYQITNTFNPTASSGFHWSDPHIAIQWPDFPTIVSARDMDLPPFDFNYTK